MLLKQQGVLLSAGVLLLQVARPSRLSAEPGVSCAVFYALFCQGVRAPGLPHAIAGGPCAHGSTPTRLDVNHNFCGPDRACRTATSKRQLSVSAL